jgi:hypothetical protein
MIDAIKNLQEELAIIDAKLKYLLKMGSNDESLVDDKRELQLQIAILKGEKYAHVRKYS